MKVISLVSGGIDSPVACALAAEQHEVVPVHFCLFPQTSEESFHLAIDAVRGLRKVANFEKLILYPWGEVLEAIRGSKKPSYTCVLCRRGMLRAAERLCELEGARGIVTGESLGQKASQTLQNLAATSSGSKYPILRPLLGMDKKDIEEISKQLGIWRAQHAGGCFAEPSAPVTKAKPEEVDRLFEDLKISEIMERNLEKILEVRTFEEDFESYLSSLRRHAT